MSRCSSSCKPSQTSTITNPMNRSFLDQEPPPGYVAGVGRGAVGFTTNADARSSKLEPEFVPQEDEPGEDGDFLYENGDNDQDGGILITGADSGAVAAKNGTDDDDLEADKIYQQIENRMTTKKNQDDSMPQTVVLKFSDLKRDLSNITVEQWENLPEVGDLTRRNKRLRLLQQLQQRTYAAPDSLIAGAGSGQSTDFKSISTSRDRLLTKHLDSLLPSSIPDNSDILQEIDHPSPVQIANVNKARQVLESLRKTEPHKSSSWIASARLEEQANNLAQALRLINEGCRMAPRNEDIWIESIRLHQLTAEGSKLCRAIASEGLKLNFSSETLWTKAYELEKDPVSKRKVLMKALESLPASVVLWEYLISLEDEQEAVKKLLAKAVELCSKHWQFWLALINLSEYDDAKKLLNRARKALAGYYEVWITASKLEEKHNPSIDNTKILKLLEKAFSGIELDSMPSRKAWFDLAATAEAEGFNKTCRAIVMNAAKLGDENNRLKLLLSDASHYSKQSSLTSNFIFDFIIDNYPNSIESWIEVFDSFKKSGDYDRLFAFYDRARQLNPDVIVFSLMYAKDKWTLVDDVHRARQILLEASTAHPESEELWFARVKLEVKTSNFENSLTISKQSIKECSNSSRIWYKHIHLLRCLNWLNPDLSSINDILKLVDEALSMFPECAKLYLQKAQILLQDSKIKEAREAASVGVKACPESVELWILLAQIDEQYLKIIIRSRSVLDSAIMKIPNSDKLWEAKIMLERRTNDLVSARQLTNKAMKLFPQSSRIRIQYLSLIPKMSQRKNALVDALKATNNSASILLGIGILFWSDGKIPKAKPWFERSLKSEANNGDCWAWLFSYSKLYSTELEQTAFIDQFKKLVDNINRGDTWNKINKSVENFTKEPLQILELVSLELLQSQA